MKFLSIDTSSKALYIGVETDSGYYFFYEEDLKLQHSETLLIKLDNLLKQKEIKLEDIDYFCCNVGPGSFTGIRIGITTIRAFAQIYNKPVIAVNSLELKAYNIDNKNIIIPLIDAVTGKFYCAAYYKGKEILSPFVCTVENLSTIKNKLPDEYKDTIIQFVYENEIESVENIIKPLTPPDYREYIKEKIKAGKFCDYNDLLPIYAQLSQAEANYEDKHKKVD